MRRWTAIVLLLLTFGAAAEEIPDQAREWLQRMVRAVKELNYEGVFVYAHGNQLESMRIVHGADGDGEHERVVSLNGAAREILRDDNVLTCILPDSRSVVVEKSRPKRFVPEQLLNLDEALSGLYEFQVRGTDRVAGRTARLLVIQPRDDFRYGYRLWLDEDTGMLLKSDLINTDGQVLEQMMFTELHIRDRIDQAQLQPSISGQGFKWYQPKEANVEPRENAKRWRVAELPPGFHMSMRAEHPMPMSAMPVEHLMYTDGLASVSVYIEQRGTVQEALNGASRMGAVNAFGVQVAGHQATVMGEVPRATVEMIARTLQYRSEH